MGIILLNNIIDWAAKKTITMGIVVWDHRGMNNFLEQQRFTRVGDKYELRGLLKYKKEERTCFSYLCFLCL